MPQQKPALPKRSSDNFSGRCPSWLCRNPHVCIAPSKARGHNPNQRSRYPIQDKGLVDNSPIGGELLHPRLVTQDEHRRRTGFVIGWLHHPPQQRRHPQELKGPRRHEIAVEPLCSLSRTVQHVRLVIGDHPVKYMILFHIIQKLRSGVSSSPSRLTPFRVVD